MAIEKVGLYRNYYGPKTNSSGEPIPRDQWPKKRAHSWVVRWFGSDGQRYSKSFTTRKEAERYAEKRQRLVREGKASPPPKRTLAEFRREHEVLMQGNLAAKTLHMHLAAIDLLAAKVGWDRSIAHISVRDMESFRASRLRTGICSASANREIKTLRRVFNLAILRGYLAADTNPCTGLPMLKVSSKRPAYVMPSEFEAIFRQAPDVLWRAMLVVLYTTGLRLRELTNLTWSDVEFGADRLHVTRKSASGYVQAWTPKDHEMRTIPLPAQAMTILASWQSLAPERCPYVFMEHGRWDFYRDKADDGTWRSGQDLINNLLRRFKTLCRRAGVDPYTIHDLRRSCITNWAKALPIHVVQELAGHSDIKTTRQFYLSVQEEDVAKAQAVQQGLVRGIPTSIPTDQLLTNSARKRVFPGRRAFESKTQALD